MTSSSSRAIGAVVLIAVAAGVVHSATSAAPSPAPQWNPHPGPPPIRRFSATRTTPQFLDKGLLQGEIFDKTQSPSFSIFWESELGGAYLSQKISTSYYITWILSSADSQFLYVAGKRRSNGHTVIERMTIEEPKTITNVNDPTDLVILPAEISEIITLYDDAVEGRDYVRAVLENRRYPERLFVRFDDSGDLYDLDTSSSGYPITLIASHTGATPPSLQTPALSQITTTARTAHHDTLGHVYMLTTDGLTANYDCLVFSDVDGNGTLDNAYTLDTQGWTNLNLHSSEFFVSLEK